MRHPFRVLTGDPESKSFDDACREAMEFDDLVEDMAQRRAFFTSVRNAAFDAAEEQRRIAAARRLRRWDEESV